MSRRCGVSRTRNSDRAGPARSASAAASVIPAWRGAIQRVIRSPPAGPTTRARRLRPLAEVSSLRGCCGEATAAKLVLLVLRHVLAGGDDRRVILLRDLLEVLARHQVLEV